MRDHADNVVIVCSIENIDPMGVHTGDSITVAPAMTLTDREYQVMRDAAVAVIREIGVEAGGCNIQFAINPRRRRDGRDRDEPARLAVVGAGLEGDRIPDRADRREARRRLPARRDPERHHQDDAGVVRAGARLRRREVPALRVREIRRREPASDDADEVRRRVDGDRPDLQGGVSEGAARARDRRGRAGRSAPRRWTIACPTTRSRRCAARSRSRRRSASSRSSARSSGHVGRRDLRADGDRPVVPARCRSCWRPSGGSPRSTDADAPTNPHDEAHRVLRPAARRRCAASAKRMSARVAGRSASDPSYKMVDTCAGEFPSSTPYLYSCYDEESEAPKTGRRSVVILGSGPNRIGQGVEFDYCCVRAVHGAPRPGIRDDHDQLEPRDGLDRLRHLGQAVFRAAHARGRAGDRSTRAARRCDRAAWRSDAAQARRVRSRRRA